jgi:hypothetical protein
LFVEVKVLALSYEGLDNQISRVYHRSGDLEVPGKKGFGRRRGWFDSRFVRLSELPPSKSRNRKFVGSNPTDSTNSTNSCGGRVLKASCSSPDAEGLQVTTRKL